MDETHLEVLFNEFFESLLFRYQKKVYGANQRLSIFFQIDFEVIKTIRSKKFSFNFAENIGKFMILRRDIGKVRSFCKFCGISLNVQRAKTKFKIAGAWEFCYMQECCSINDSNVRSLRVRHRGLRCRYGNHGV